MDNGELRQLKITLKRMRETKPHEGICLMGWQVKLILDYIKTLKVRANHEQGRCDESRE